jgi:uncharacterized membrane protein
MKNNLAHKEKRPILDIPRSYLEMMLSGAALIGLITLLSLVLSYWPRLPDVIPTHFGFSGEADAWGSKGMLWILPVAALFIYIALTGVSYFPHLYNYPWAITAENAQRQYIFSRTFLGFLKTEIVWFFTYIEWITIQVSLGTKAGLGSSFLPVFLIIIFGTLIIYMIMAGRAR